MICVGNLILRLIVVEDFKNSISPECEKKVFMSFSWVLYRYPPLRKFCTRYKIRGLPVIITKKSKKQHK